MAVDPFQRAPAAIVLVHTGEYSGNFEREMVAWMTAQFGECTVGTDLATRARNELHETEPLREFLAFCNTHVVKLPDDYDCRRPASIWPTPSLSKRREIFQTVAAFFDARPVCDAHLELLESRARFFAAQYHSDGDLVAFRMARFRDKPIEITGFDVLYPDRRNSLSTLMKLETP